MVSLKWGDVLSTVLPGAVALFAISPYFPPLWEHVTNLDQTSLATGVGLLFGSALAGGVLEGISRITWERHISKKCPLPKDLLYRLTPENLDLYERGVQSSYKYVTFYSNLAIACALTLVTFVVKSPNRWSFISVVLLVAPAILLRASFVQWTYYVNYMSKVFAQRGGSDAEKRSTAGHEGEIYSGGTDSEGVRHGNSEAGSRNISGGPSGRSKRGDWASALATP